MIPAHPFKFILKARYRRTLTLLRPKQMPDWRIQIITICSQKAVSGPWNCDRNNTERLYAIKNSNFFFVHGFFRSVRPNLWFDFRNPNIFPPRPWPRTSRINKSVLVVTSEWRTPAIVLKNKGILTLTTRQAWADDRSNISQHCQKNVTILNVITIFGISVWNTFK